MTIASIIIIECCGHIKNIKKTTEQFSHKTKRHCNERAYTLFGQCETFLLRKPNFQVDHHHNDRWKREEFTVKHDGKWSRHPNGRVCPTYPSLIHQYPPLHSPTISEYTASTVSSYISIRTSTVVYDLTLSHIGLYGAVWGVSHIWHQCPVPTLLLMKQPWGGGDMRHITHHHILLLEV